MKRSKSIVFVLAAAFLFLLGCDSKTDTVTKGREAVKEVVTQPFNTLESAKESLTKSEDQTKTAIEEFDKESKQP